LLLRPSRLSPRLKTADTPPIPKMRVTWHLKWASQPARLYSATRIARWSKPQALVALTAARKHDDIVGRSHVSPHVMSPVPLASSSDQGLHFVLCDFGRYGRAYVETDPAKADASTIVRNFLQGQYGRPLLGRKAGYGMYQSSLLIKCALSLTANNKS